MTNVLNLILQISMLVFIVGNVLDIGLGLKFQGALAGLKNLRFVFQSLLWGFILCPALAILLTKVLPLDPAYSTGLILMGLAPCAPLLPMMAAKSRGDLGYTASFILLASVVTVVYMPFAVPILLKGVSVTAWAIAKPLLLYILLPLIVAMLIKEFYETFADRVQPYVKKTTSIATIIMLAAFVFVYYKDLLSAVGEYAILTLLLFFLITIVASYIFSFGLPTNQKSILSLGVSTRNLGAAFATLASMSQIDQRATVIVALAVPIQVILSLIAAGYMGRSGAKEGAELKAS
jgi:BASS family bile acid:Na+ symporter